MHPISTFVRNGRTFVHRVNPCWLPSYLSHLCTTVVVPGQNTSLVPRRRLMRKVVGPVSWLIVSSCTDSMVIAHAVNNWFARPFGLVILLEREQNLSQLYWLVWMGIGACQFLEITQVIGVHHFCNIHNYGYGADRLEIILNANPAFEPLVKQNLAQPGIVPQTTVTHSQGNINDVK